MVPLLSAGVIDETNDVFDNVIVFKQHIITPSIPHTNVTIPRRASRAKTSTLKPPLLVTDSVENDCLNASNRLQKAGDGLSTEMLQQYGY